MQASPDMPAGPLTWTVGPQTLTSVSDGRGGYEPGYHILFTLSNGHQDAVDVPTSAYTPDNVRAAIQAKAEQIAAVYGLTGTAG